MAFCQVRSCCCGCSLETGTKILAILGIIVYALNLITIKTGRSVEAIVISISIIGVLGLIVKYVMQ